MTTIVAIRTNAGEDGIVLAADTQSNVYSGEELDTKSIGYKMWVGRNWALAYTGVYTPELVRLKGMLSGLKRYHSSEDRAKEIIKRALTPRKSGQRVFEEVLELNSRVRSKGSIEDCLEFVLATNEPEFGVWHVHEFGVLRNAYEFAKAEGLEISFENIVIGTGSEIVRSYLDEISEGADGIDVTEITLPVAIRVASNAVFKARRDAATGGTVDLAVLTRNSVKAFGREIERKVRQAEISCVEEIAAHYSSESEAQ
ncbi:hypothetical protein D6817_05735 [Candidatus Pacearchaeota archaeon]|nr:MAG: hypothetical protein D6817_05735 [Candidatus Pacearchaeota archaeon]